MTALLQVPVPEGDLGLLQEAERSLDRQARLVESGSSDLQTLGQRTGAEWVGKTAVSFGARVTRTRSALDTLATTQHRAGTLVREYAGEWEWTRQRCRSARDDVDAAAADYRSRARAGAGRLAAEIRAGIERLDDPVEDVPLVGDVAGQLTSAGAAAAEAVIERLLTWDPSVPSATLLTVTHEAVLDDAVGAARDLGAGAEWGVETVLAGVDAVVDLVGGAARAAVQALRSVGEAFVEAVQRALRAAAAAVRQLLELGRQIAIAMTHLADDAASAIAEATTDAASAADAFLHDVGAGWFATFRMHADLGILLLTGLATLFDRDADGASRRMDERLSSTLDLDALVMLESQSHLRKVKTAQALADAAYRDVGAPGGWVRARTFDGRDGFYAAAFQNFRSGEVVLAFRGSQTGPIDLPDWRDDAVNAADLPTSQGRQALEAARALADDPRFRGQSASYTGHSLGGSLASNASMMTGLPAMTFNAAGVGDGNYRLAMAAGGAGRSEEQIVNYSTAPDILTYGQTLLAARPAAGAQVTAASTTNDRVAAHKLQSFDWQRTVGRG